MPAGTISCADKIMKKALIFYISRHSGHFHAASAIEQGLVSVLGNIEVDKINAFSYTNPILEKVINKAYMQVIKKRPEIWGNIYDNPEFMKKTSKAREAIHKFNMSKVRKLIDAHDPDVVLCTQAFPCGMVADYKRSIGKDTPLIGVLTDHAPHSYWLYDEVDYYIVPSEETGETLIKKGVPSKKVKAYGIPVDPKFSVGLDREDVKERLKLEGDAPVILIMGGSQGIGAMEVVVRSLLSDEEHNYRLVVVTGTNKKLYSKLKKLEKKKTGGRLMTMTYVKNIEELMEVSDVIISKPGGMTIAESMVKRLPLIIVDPIPGHERLNTDYLVRKGVAVEIKNIDAIHQSMNELFDAKGVIDGMKIAAGKIARPDSALNIAKLVKDIL
ncbi:MAG: glycosyltransferase [Candidatus Omnitrophica bacterium]|nr:glycosyltransferase [Candidatus Omnitrophota bacterium]MDD5487360.1 glycosyltransferase [Candidatus Omnitrophota bacterium]